MDSNKKACGHAGQSNVTECGFTVVYMILMLYACRKCLHFVDSLKHRT